MSNDAGILTDLEGNASYKQGYEVPYSYDTASKNTVSTGTIKERNVYNPSAYAANMSSDLFKQYQQPASNQSKGYADDNYENGEGYLQRSPQGNKAFTQFNANKGALPSRRNEGSPKIAWVSNTIKNDFAYNNT